MQRAQQGIGDRFTQSRIALAVGALQPGKGRVDFPAPCVRGSDLKRHGVFAFVDQSAQSRVRGGRVAASVLRQRDAQQAEIRNRFAFGLVERLVRATLQQSRAREDVVRDSGIRRKVERDLKRRDCVVEPASAHAAVAEHDMRGLAQGVERDRASRQRDGIFEATELHRETGGGTMNVAVAGRERAGARSISVFAPFQSQS